jgi:K+-transporting ATPase ATPase C chain
MKMLRLLVILTLICGVVYPLTVTVIGRFIFHDKANGSLIIVDGKVVGSELLSQKFTRKEFFHSRPSAADYATIPSGASQSSPTQKSGTDLREQRRKDLPEAGIDFWTSSGSGLDPHISPKTAYAQISRIAAGHSLSSSELMILIDRFVEGPTFGIWGQPRVNVLKLNLELLSQGKNANTR